MRTMQRFLADQRAVTAIEYALIGGLIAIAVVAGARAIGTSLSAKFAPISANLS